MSLAQRRPNGLSNEKACEVLVIYLGVIPVMTQPLHRLAQSWALGPQKQEFVSHIQAQTLEEGGMTTFEGS